MAVLIQPMLAPQVAGVAFTADPVTGDRGTVRVSGVVGVGDLVGSGEVLPDEWDVTGGIATRRGDAGRVALDASQAQRIAEVAVAIEDAFGSPQDVEWAIVDDEVVVLQARPITALPVPPQTILDGRNWEKDVTHYPELLTPFGWSVQADPARIAAVFAGFGLLIDGLESRLIGGEVYVRPVPVIGSADSKAKAPPAWGLGLAARVVPRLRRRMRAAQAAVNLGLERWPRRWEDVERDEMLTRIKALRNVELTALDGNDLVAHLDEVRSLAADGAESHFNIALPYFVFLHRLDTLMSAKLGWTFDRTVALLASPASVAAAGLAEIRIAVAADPRLQDALDKTPSDPIGALTSIDGGTGDKLRAWFDHHGWRTAGYDAGSPALIERPVLVTRLITGPASEAPLRKAEAEFQAAVSTLSDGEQIELMGALARARWVYPMREDNVIIADNIPSGLARRWLLEAARRLLDAGQIAQTSDAAFLEASEITRALSEGDIDLDPLVAQRRREWAWTLAHPGPVSVGDQTSPPDITNLPQAGRLINGALLWAMSHEYPGDVERTNQVGVLSGSPGSAGIYRGSVRIIRGESDFEKLQTGEVLVCPVTTPAWAVLFPIAGALVTDGGGVLSHAAIVAREHALPAVLGTRNGTSRLAKGQFVEVDGTAGVVRIL